ncbi:MAG TPA: hypothetical protein VG938_14795 [Verrucomicrobiae bacterium]|nr:hypothetical protein [Verrucomicrobiae bacterium]
MKIISFLTVLVCLSFVGPTASGQSTNKLLTGINFVNVPAEKVLDIYQASTKSQLIIASNVRLENRRITLHVVNVSPEVAQQMIEQALLKQAGIVITRLDAQQVSVTYNDQLKLTP